jgi:S-adenosylmethionine hydrolase
MPGMTLSPAPIALLTDFGTSDPYVGVMKGVMLGLCPAATFVDLTHAIAPQNVRQAAFALWTAYRYFPPDTVFLAVVDPGVGSTRRAIAVETARGRFVGPDNGLFGDVLAEVGSWRAVALDPARVALAGASFTFHGRDLFAPAAARLAAGAPLESLGTPLDTLVTLPPPAFASEPGALTGEVIYIDHFGNVVTSLGQFAWQSDGSLRLSPRLRPGADSLSVPANHLTITIGQQRYAAIVSTYAHSAPGDSLALINSAGMLEIAVNQGHAARQLGLAPGMPGRVRWTP